MNCYYVLSLLQSQETYIVKHETTYQTNAFYVPTHSARLHEEGNLMFDDREAALKRIGEYGGADEYSRQTPPESDPQFPQKKKFGASYWQDRCHTVPGTT